ncbi:hypothetical protein [Microbacterium thalassium]|uniref:Uncharacterized protein n=1 Tax=Microbacterium thalassium TaxID=362649 RepID=A0A7X0FP24_9MICO|nr:hypothetical protein [Microbacterium thalassium]MBB6391058.1 hypothetical protein [Microbacterium thalassium]
MAAAIATPGATASPAVFTISSVVVDFNTPGNAITVLSGTITNSGPEVVNQTVRLEITKTEGGVTTVVLPVEPNVYETTVSLNGYGDTDFEFGTPPLPIDIKPLKTSGGGTTTYTLRVTYVQGAVANVTQSFSY